ncbi:MAG: ribbon-helix-helix protein, CopG family [Actinomycetota bacterium]|jgi:metal-responsive CopG/Arc/MetJ family transcriptional regulator|nr:ribbon-helix-helix protein, CopG family [Rubrobacter sp.]MDQ3509933.1 ribbon-helix-helix protein, CopG family [Actinomycetota bacterium]
MSKVKKVKTAISIDAELFEKAEERAGKMGVSRSELFSRAVEKLVRDEESREITERLNESYADGLDEEDEAALRHLQSLQRQALESNEW